MNELKKLIDYNAWSGINENDETMMKWLSFSIVGKYKIQVTHPNFQTFEFNDPFPTQYCILMNKPKCLKHILDLLIGQNKNIIEIFRSPYSNSKYPLLHLAVITMNTRCLETLIKYLKNLKASTKITEEDYNTIINMNCNYRHPLTEKYFRHTALYYSLKHYESFEMLCDLANADPFQEMIEEDESDSAITDPNKKMSVFMCLIFSGICQDINKFVEYLKQNYQNDYANHCTTIKYDPITYRVDQNGGKTLNEIFESFSTKLSPYIKNALLLLINNPHLKPISTEDVSKNSKQLIADVDNDLIASLCANSGCEQKAISFCNKCKKGFCDEHIMNHCCS